MTRQTLRKETRAAWNATEVATYGDAVTDPLTLHAREIERQFSNLDVAEHKVVGLRIAVGRTLIAAREAVDEEHGPGHWQTWCRENIRDRKQRDIRKLMRLAGAEDPEAAAAEEREATKARMARIREERPHVRAVESAHLRLVEPVESDTAPETSVEPSPEPAAELETATSARDMKMLETLLSRVLPREVFAWATDTAWEGNMSLGAWVVELIEWEMRHAG